jgi:poly-beta-1,6-N-acetyl-D-glucosamine N-deacetylase
VSTFSGAGMLPDRQSSHLPRRLRRNGLAFVVGWLAIVGLLIGLGTRVHVGVPAFGDGGSDVRAQVAPAPSASLPPDLVARLRALPSPGPHEGPLVLTFHGVEPGPLSPFAISPGRLQSELTLLHAAGYRTISAARFLAWQHGGRPLPPKSVLLTFDDGLAAEWRYVDPILAQLGFHATAFLITGHIDGGAFYLTSGEVRRMAESGRWSFGAHTAHGHTYVPTKPHAPLEAFLVARRWLPAQRRRETLAEFTRRVRLDTSEALAWFSAHRLPRPRLFAYPFSAVSSPDAAATAASGRILAATFAARFLDDSTGGMTSAAQQRRGLFRRLDVLGTDSLPRFVSEIEAATPLPPARTRTLAAGIWTRGSGTGRVVVRPTGLTLQAGKSGWLETALAPTRTLSWRAYDVSAQASGLDGTAAAGISVPMTAGAEISLSVSRGWFEVRGGADRAVLAQGPLPERSQHWLRVRVGGGKAAVAVDAEPVADVPVAHATGGPSLYVSAAVGTQLRFTQIRVR